MTSEQYSFSQVQEDQINQLSKTPSFNSKCDHILECFIACTELLKFIKTKLVNQLVVIPSIVNSVTPLSAPCFTSSRVRTGRSYKLFNNYNTRE